MRSDRRPSRRTLLRIGAAASLAMLAGCPDDEDEPADDDVDDEVNDEDDDVDEEWEDIGEFVFEGRIEAWTGVEPAIIEGEDNPTLTLIEGQEYDFTWINADGVVHNLEIRDGDDEIIDDYQSEDLGDEGEETTLEGVVASEEMDVYICTYHETTQVGDITVETG
ncbi:cupredoxin domain-containing protein [Natrarchaeobius chitinivorans]|uniref:PKD domain-containing protein n=1 Tax=Natrarchaeobius chitinivorans TaxID=1679083 RepID=A0A3N6MFM1_NATCH|nr:PKD domain-containing protein [Natrarchaeobius chitinivorans]RQG95550.1 PKD domain-containing protein [Natrarchaeobius chitinivorans]